MVTGVSAAGTGSAAGGRHGYGVALQGMGGHG